jgi:riboflavin-specific deaminase-like protein
MFEEWLSQADQHYQRSGRPLVSLCFAQSLDGCLAARRGQPTALSGSEAMRLTHQLRAAHDAILVGVGTVLSDNPRLTVRMAPGRNPQPVILDSRLRTPPDAYLITQHPSPAWIATSERAPLARRSAQRAAGTRLLLLPGDAQGHVHLPTLLERLAESGIRSLMVEGGAQVLTSFLEQGLADWAAITIAPVLLGGLHSVQRNLPGLTRLSQVHHEHCGEDLVVFGTFTF